MPREELRDAICTTSCATRSCATPSPGTAVRLKQQMLHETLTEQGTTRRGPQPGGVLNPGGGFGGRQPPNPEGSGVFGFGGRQPPNPGGSSTRRGP